MSTPFLLIGLGNPGKSYAGNRHNAGFMAIDALQEKYAARPEIKKFGGLISEGTMGESKLLFFKPQSYMNLSGEPALQVAQFFKIPLSHIIVFHDELDLPLAKIRVKVGGGAGGHNGLKSLDQHLGKEYKRVRLGIGHPGDKNLVSDYVLHDFSKEELKEMAPLFENIAKHASLLLQGHDAAFMNKLAPGEAKPKKEKQV